MPRSVFCCFYVIAWLVRNTPVRGGKFHFAQTKITLGFILRNCGLAVFFRLVFHVSLLHFFPATYVTLLCACGVITSRLIRDWYSKRNCHYEAMLEVNICYNRPFQYVDVLKLFHYCKK